MTEEIWTVGQKVILGGLRQLEPRFRRACDQGQRAEYAEQ
jgi:hypothetical protein